MEKRNTKAWLYLLPALFFLGFFMVYPLIDVFIYSFEEGYNFASQTYFGVGSYNYAYVLRDPYFLQAVKNTLILVIITVPLSTAFALLLSAALSSIKPLRNLFQTVYFCSSTGSAAARLISLTDHTGPKCLYCAFIRSGLSCHSRCCF